MQKCSHKNVLNRSLVMYTKVFTSETKLTACNIKKGLYILFGKHFSVSSSKHGNVESTEWIWNKNIPKSQLKLCGRLGAPIKRAPHLKHIVIC